MKLKSPKTKKSKQSKEELLRHLSEHILFLISSSDSYDRGFWGEAKRLALSIRVLLHNTGSSRSLLEQLQCKTSFYDSCLSYDPRNLASFHGLVGIKMGGNNTSFWPRLGETLPNQKVIKRPFANWWNQVVIVDKNKTKFSRRSLVCYLANQDGGAHVDPGLDEEYAQLSRGNSIGWIVGNGDHEEPLRFVELASVRQIAYEVLRSLRDEFPSLFLGLGY
jgi:hypothetical protein